MVQLLTTDQSLAKKPCQLMDVKAQEILVNNKDILRDQEKQRHELDGEAYAAHKT